MAQASSPTMLRGGTVVNDQGQARADVIIADGLIVDVGSSLEVPTSATVIDASDTLIFPGLVDLHTHLREPGREEAETVESGARAAALGGYTAVVAMPNTEPCTDSPEVVRLVLSLAKDAVCDIAVAGAITIERAGELLSPMAEMASLGVSLFTDDGSGVQDGGVMRRALQYAHGLGLTLAQHCEDNAIANGGCMHEGMHSGRLGLPGIPASAEEAMLARDLLLVAETGASMHFLHLSTAASVVMVAQAKKAGLPVTCEVAPHHLVLTDQACCGYDPIFKVNPPLRSADDVAGLCKAVLSGAVEAIATDHAPHPPQAKDLPFDEASPGMLGLETALSLIAGVVVHEGKGSWSDVVRLLSTNPAKIAKLRASDPRLGGQSAQGGSVSPGEVANLCVFDAQATWTASSTDSASRSANLPYEGWPMQGRVRHTLLRGEAVVLDGQAQR
ncbi:MAG: dihydroorotase [Actinomycetes bacterium]